MFIQVGYSIFIWHIKQFSAEHKVLNRADSHKLLFGLKKVTLLNVTSQAASVSAQMESLSGLICGLFDLRQWEFASEH
ncbi:hypothetical protein TDB9533_02686 [Thalassocella blandensis]|nr:hypothetical protein TDB9533_02686 [Thalassocella blandensis]